MAHHERTRGNIDEVRLAAYSPDLQNAEILEVKRHMQDCHEIEIPEDHMLILDNILIKPVELTEDQREITVPVESESESGFAGLRNMVNGSVTNDADIVKPISGIVGTGKSFGGVRGRQGKDGGRTDAGRHQIW